jgi:hypothetical protein
LQTRTQINHLDRSLNLFGFRHYAFFTHADAPRCPAI